MGILVYDAADSIFVRNNIFLQNSFYDSYTSIHVQENSNALITYNTFIGDKRRRAIFISTTSVIKNNIIINFDEAIVKSDAGRAVISHNNIFNNNTNFSLLEGETFALIPGTGEISLDQLFRGEFVPALNSPVIGAGENGTTIGATPSIQRSRGIPEYSLTDYFLNFKGSLEGESFSGININKTAELSFSVGNHRNSPLVITGINNFRSDAFNVIEPGSFPQTISVDDSLKFIIEFSPNEARHSNPFDKTLSVFTDDVSDAVFNVFLLGVSQVRA